MLTCRSSAALSSHSLATIRHTAPLPFVDSSHCRGRVALGPPPLALGLPPAHTIIWSLAFGASTCSSLQHVACGGLPALHRWLFHRAPSPPHTCPVPSLPTLTGATVPGLACPGSVGAAGGAPTGRLRLKEPQLSGESRSRLSGSRRPRLSAAGYFHGSVSRSPTSTSYSGW